MKGDENDKSALKRCRGKESESTGAAGNSDSDCEIMEPHISVIDLNDSLEESDVGRIEREADDSVVLEGSNDGEEANALPNNIDRIDAIIEAIDRLGAVECEETNGDGSKSASEASDFLFTIAFNDRDKFDCLRDFVKDAIKKCLEERSVLVDMIEDDRSLSVKIVEKLGPDNVTDLIFAVDTTPANNPEVSAIPSYRRSIREVFNDEKKKEIDEDECPSFKRMSMCFNCSGSHSLKDCPEPKNQQRINKARKAMQSKYVERYHVDIEQRYAHIRPGRVSDTLRRAMGLKKNEIPPFIYRMRILGYPPGWLEEAKVAHSGLALFDSEGREVQDPEEEDGELNEGKHKYDVRKIISFPGFNCETEPGLIEDTRMPPMLHEYQKDEFIKSLGDNIVKGYKRKKLTNLNASESEKLALNSEDMEIEEDIPVPQLAQILTAPLPPPLPVEIPEQPAPPPEETPPDPQPKPTFERLSRKRKRSPTLEDLEAKQRALLEALENPSPALDATVDDSLIDEILEVQNMQENTESPLTLNTNNDAAPFETTSLDINAIELPQTPIHENVTNKKCSSVLGTPVLKFSPYDSLPSGEQFSKGVSDVINFENLPDSTGKYEKMVRVIEKVRKAVLRSNEEI